MVETEQQKEDGQMKLPMEQCPWCGGREFVVGYQGYEAMMTYTPQGLTGKRIQHLLCKRCGMVLASRVADTSKYQNARKAW